MEATDQGWTRERIARLKELWPQDLSAAKIARELGGGLSRNAVIGKAKRMGLPRRAPVPPPKPKPRPRKPGRTHMFAVPSFGAPKRVSAVPVVDAEIPLSQRKSFLELENHHCRWPVGDPGEPGFFFCGAPSADLEEGRPYCAAHHAVAFVPPITGLSEDQQHNARGVSKDGPRGERHAPFAFGRRMAGG